MRHVGFFPKMIKPLRVHKQVSERKRGERREAAIGQFHLCFSSRTTFHSQKTIFTHSVGPKRFQNCTFTLDHLLKISTGVFFAKNGDVMQVQQ